MAKKAQRLTGNKRVPADTELLFTLMKKKGFTAAGLAGAIKVNEITVRRALKDKKGSPKFLAACENFFGLDAGLLRQRKKCKKTVNAGDNDVVPPESPKVDSFGIREDLKNASSPDEMADILFDAANRHDDEVNVSQVLLENVVQAIQNVRSDGRLYTQLNLQISGLNPIGSIAAVKDLERIAALRSCLHEGSSRFSKKQFTYTESEEYAAFLHESDLMVILNRLPSSLQTPLQFHNLADIIIEALGHFSDLKIHQPEFQKGLRFTADACREFPIHQKIRFFELLGFLGFFINTDEFYRRYLALVHEHVLIENVREMTWWKNEYFGNDKVAQREHEKVCENHLYGKGRGHSALMYARLINVPVEELLDKYKIEDYRLIYDEAIKSRRSF